VTIKSPVGDISVVTLIRTDTTLDHSQKAEKVYLIVAENLSFNLINKQRCSSWNTPGLNLGLWCILCLGYGVFYAWAMVYSASALKHMLAPHIKLTASLLQNVNDIIGATAVYIDVAV